MPQNVVPRTTAMTTYFAFNAKAVFVDLVTKPGVGVRRPALTLKNGHENSLIGRQCDWAIELS